MEVAVGGSPNSSSPPKYSLTIAPGGTRPARCQVSAVRRKPGSNTEMLGAAASSAVRVNIWATSA
jgi:hypothetical protein